MKKAICFSIAILMAFTFSAISDVSSFASSKNEKKEIIIRPRGKINHGHRAPAKIPIEAYYNSFISGIAITFLQDLGNVEMNVTNHSTGEYLEGTTTATTGTTVLPISGTEGVYTITFTLSNGTEYEGEFEL